MEGGMNSSGAEHLIVLIQLSLPVALLVITYFIGHWVEKKHYISIRQREEKFLNMPALTFRTLPTVGVTVNV